MTQRKEPGRVVPVCFALFLFFGRKKSRKQRVDTTRLRPLRELRVVSPLRHLVFHIIDRAPVIIHRPYPFDAPAIRTPNLPFLESPPLTHFLANPSLKPFANILPFA